MSHLGNFAHNVGQRIVLNHAIVYNEAVRGGIHGYILLPILWARPQLRSWSIRFAESNHERTIFSKIRDSLIFLQKRAYVS